MVEKKMKLESTKCQRDTPGYTPVPYEAKVFIERKSPLDFAVCLMETPPWPNNKPALDGVDDPPVAVVGATDKGGEWSFVHLEQAEKECIGERLIAMNAKHAEWLWCELLEGV